MSQPDFDRALERMATDPTFATAVRANPASALDGYELSEAERRELAGMQTAVPAATPAPAALATRRSKTSMLGIGAFSAVAVIGAGGFGYIHYMSYSRAMSLDGGARQAISTVSQDGAGEIGSISAPAAGSSSNSRLAITKQVDSTSPVLHEDAVTGRPIGSVTVVVQKGGSDWLTYQGSSCLVVSDAIGGASSGGSTPVETLTFQCQTINLSYP